VKRSTSLSIFRYLYLISRSFWKSAYSTRKMCG